LNLINWNLRAEATEKREGKEYSALVLCWKMFYFTYGIRTILSIHPSDMGMLVSHNKDDLNKNDLLKKELFEKVEEK